MAIAKQKGNVLFAAPEEGEVVFVGDNINDPVGYFAVTQGGKTHRVTLPGVDPKAFERMSQQDVEAIKQAVGLTNEKGLTAGSLISAVNKKIQTQIGVSDQQLSKLNVLSPADLAEGGIGELSADQVKPNIPKLGTYAPSLIERGGQNYGTAQAATEAYNKILQGQQVKAPVITPELAKQSVESGVAPGSPGGKILDLSTSGTKQFGDQPTDQIIRSADSRGETFGIGPGGLHQEQVNPVQGPINRPAPNAFGATNLAKNIASQVPKTYQQQGPTSQQLFEQIKSGQLYASKENPEWTALYQGGQATQAQKDAFAMWEDFAKKNPGYQVPGNTPKAAPTSESASWITAPKNPVQEINQQANTDQEGEFEKVKSETNKVDLSESAQLVEKLLDTLNAEQEEPTSLAETFSQKKAELGIDPLETSLSGIDADIAKLDADFTSLIGEEENRRVSVRRIGQRQSVEELAYQRQRRDLLAERDSVANQLNMKYGVLNSYITLTGQDIDNARQLYNDQFQKNITMINLLKGIEDSQKNDLERKADDARANIQIMSSLIQDGNVAYDDLDVATQLNIKQLEMMAGLPVGFTSFLSENIKEPVTSFLPAFTDVDGNRIQPIATTNADGSFGIQNIVVGKVQPPGAGGGSSGGTKKGVGVGGGGSKGEPWQALNVEDGSSGGQCGRFVNSYTKLAVGDLYQEKLDKMDTSIKKPEAGMVFLMPYKNTGHTGFIINPSVDENGEPADNGKYSLVKDSNWQGNEKVLTHVIPNSKFTAFQRVWSDQPPGQEVFSKTGAATTSILKGKPLPSSTPVEPTSKEKNIWDY